MACNLQCPACGNVLREEGDEDHRRDGPAREYRVYDSLPNSVRRAGEFRLALCLVCGHAAAPSLFDR